MKKVLLDVKNLKQYFNTGRKDEVKAVDDITFHIYEGETFGLVGESGSGKSTTGRSIIRLNHPTDGTIEFDGKDVMKLHGKKEMNVFRRDVQMIFQDPYASLNGRMKVRDIIAEGIDINGLAKSDKERAERVNELLRTVGLNPNHGTRYPHEFSGGQRQRIGVARALAVDPKFIICDEPISALDVSIQAQVVNLLQDLQKEHNLTYLFIAHDLSMVKHISDRIGVMHNGKLLEVGTSDDVYYHGVHPYTESLLSAIPLPDPEYEQTRTRVKYTGEQDDLETPRKMLEIAPGHYVYATEEEKTKYQEKLANKKAAEDKQAV
ncbi:ABC transporter ATP-binding protein [Tetragenococcus koreensis]|uniref:Oligopeptide ABC transporter ATP-binding protein n=1 Tax=Tetragenococcus koreensis TaxID=290335 RepID=A0AAN4ZPU7_9ENTE|nr:ATP-binding cassette domain-containing protein [Tetragenococcus koreensis]GEQ49690.1 oligopeptide ABC transporter ATP-binding protein [Tetragenococcus koreensis]GEQ52136.1 oligopeptide ABC transporter ATP-binding protein [Tetragenococcus koreensis]GEQ54666.1 oligopeptide ABC transporter ATP-binding protein [Tetragenococcus koreensis]GEQ57138.1 oligopeptide ABC transporter ATP-binding protein [Tetragenococcus koreensis]GEQ59703.1 oligopeptide ABC transporter ATP-binding protein [Tetragenococ